MIFSLLLIRLLYYQILTGKIWQKYTYLYVNNSKLLNHFLTQIYPGMWLPNPCVVIFFVIYYFCSV